MDRSRIRHARRQCRSGRHGESEADSFGCGLLQHEPGCVGEGDALVTREPGVAVSIRTADCFPILLADPRNSRRGRGACGVARDRGRCRRNDTRSNAKRFGTEPGTFLPRSGRELAQCCYEVGVEVARQFGMEQAGKIDLGCGKPESADRRGTSSRNGSSWWEDARCATLRNFIPGAAIGNGRDGWFRSSADSRRAWTSRPY